MASGSATSKDKRIKVGDGEEVSSSNVEDTVNVSVAVEGDVPTDETAMDNTAGPSSTTKTRIVKNPLENPVVLNHLFGLCPKELIATCRLVCKEWYNESLAAWRTISTLTVTVMNGDIVLVDVSDNIAIPNPIITQTFLEYVQKPENKCSTKPYRRIRVQHCEFGSSPQQFETFWKLLGPNLTTLFFNDCTFKNVEEFRKIVYTCCPNLQSLELSRCTYPRQSSSLNEGWRVLEYKTPLYGEHKHLKSVELHLLRPDSEMDNGSEDIPVSWLEFFSHFQSLTSLKMSYLPNLETMMRLTEAIKTVRRKNADKLLFKTFSTGTFRISRDFGRELLNSAYQLRLPLDTVSIAAHPELELDFLKSTLNCHANTLKNIYAFLEEDDHGLTTPTTLMREFPFGLQLQNLEYLEIEDKLCESFTFLKYMPNLKKLDVVVIIDEEEYGLNPDMFTTTSVAVSNTPKSEMADVKMKRLTELKINCIVSDDDLQSLIQWMPNVKDLAMVLNDKQFGSICGGWRHLKSVEVLGYELTDKGITGRSKPGANSEDEDASISPNITDLQGLKSIDLWTTNLTEDSIFHGFLKLPNLRSIHFNANEISWGEQLRRTLETRKIDLWVHLGWQQH